MVMKIESLEDRRVLSAIAFVENEVSNNELIGRPIVATGDFDGDGEVDVASLAALGIRSTISWFNIRDGSSTNVPVNGISSADLAAGDIDRDGDVDLVTINLDRTVSFFENLDQSGNFAPPVQLAAFALRPNRVFIADVDGDGQDDAVITGSHGIAYLEFDGGNPSQSDVVSISEEPTSGIEVRFADVDGDQDVDLIAAFWIRRNSLVWFENVSIDGTAFEEHLIANSADGFQTLGVGDVSGDGQVDIITSTFSNRSQLLYFQNGQFDSPVIVNGASQDISIGFAAAFDVDRDGALDILASGTNALGASVVTWYRNDSIGVEVDGQLVESRDLEARAIVDLNADSFPDLVTSSPQVARVSALYWQPSSSESPFLGVPIKIAEDTASGIRAAVVGDLDGDGDNDVVGVSGSFPEVVQWYENVDGAFELRQQLSAELRQPEHVEVIDFDGDGDLDVVAAAYYLHEYEPDARVMWFENLDSRGTFGEAQLIENHLTYGLETIDVDADGNVELLSASIFGLKIYDMDAGTIQRTLISESDPVQFPRGVAVADLNNDGYDDIVYFAGERFDSDSDTLGWRLNRGGDGFSDPIILDDPLFAVSLRLIVMDEDGFVDIITATQGGIYWYRNRDGEDFEAADLLVSYSLQSATVLDAADVDGDGDIDLFGSYVADDQTSLVWYENAGDFRFSNPQRVHSIRRGRVEYVSVVDISGDGRLDIVSATLDHIRWYEQRTVGDSNADGVFDSSDLVTVFQNGEYEDSFFGNSSYRDGDWNGDGEFNSSDLVFAFQSGTYQTEQLVPAVDQHRLSSIGAVDVVFENAGKSPDDLHGVFIASREKFRLSGCDLFTSPYVNHDGRAAHPCE